MRYPVIAAAIILALAVSSAEAATSTVSVVYFYPRGQEPNMVAQVDPAVEEMQDWYGALVGSTFSADSVQVIRGKQHPSVYQADPWGPILRELGYYCGTGVHLVIVHESISPSYGGGGACPGDGGGTAVVSERWLGQGVVPHELGHAFGLPHSNCTSVMWCWWDYPDVGLTDSEIATLQSHSAFAGGDGFPKECKPFKGKGKALGRCK